MRNSKKIASDLKIVVYILILIIFVLVGLVIYLHHKYETSNKHSNMNIGDSMVSDKYQQLVRILGKPTYTEKCSQNNMKTATWMSPLHNFHDFGKFGGCDYIKMHGKPSKKYHPHPAVVFLIVGKYMKVPDHLLGPLKYASETINIEQLFVPDSYAEKYYNSGEKDLALVTGSCASIIISVITVKFVEDMIQQYQSQHECLSLYDTFRNEYDRRIHNYLCGKGITEPIPWFDVNYFEEPEIYNIGEEKCSTYQLPQNNTNVVLAAPGVSNNNHSNNSNNNHSNNKKHS